jgi:hypothetical protein
MIYRHILNHCRRGVYSPLNCVKSDRLCDNSPQDITVAYLIAFNHLLADRVPRRY